MRVINDLEVFQEGRIIPEGTLDAFVVSLELAYRELVVLDTTTQMSLLQKESSDIVRVSWLPDAPSLHICYWRNSESIFY